MYVFGCVGSWLHHVGSFVAMNRLSRCVLWARTCSMEALVLCGMQDLSSPTRDRTRVVCTARWILNRWTTKDVPFLSFLKKELENFI